jgi:hypothetical protein
MTTNAADEETFVLSDEVLDHINSFFPPPDGHHEKTLVYSYAKYIALTAGNLRQKWSKAASSKCLKTYRS